MMAAKVRKVIVEPGDGGGLLAMDAAGRCRGFATPAAVVEWVRRRDRAAAGRGVSTITVVEWRGMPEEFRPPADARTLSAVDSGSVGAQRQGEERRAKPLLAFAVVQANSCRWMRMCRGAVMPMRTLEWPSTRTSRILIDAVICTASSRRSRWVRCPAGVVTCTMAAPSRMAMSRTSMSSPMVMAWWGRRVTTSIRPPSLDSTAARAASASVRLVGASSPLLPGPHRVQRFHAGGRAGEQRAVDAGVWPLYGEAVTMPSPAGLRRGI